MKLRSRLMLFTAVAALTGNMAHASVNPQALADQYVADGYTYVEVEQSPTQIRVEAIRGESLIEVIYLTETGEILSSEAQPIDDGDVLPTGIELKVTDEDFLDEDPVLVEEEDVEDADPVLVEEDADEAEAIEADAAIGAEELAADYADDGFTYVQVEQGPTQTSVEAIKGDTLIEVVYLTETGEILSSEAQPINVEDVRPTGVEIKMTDEDYFDEDAVLTEEEVEDVDPGLVEDEVEADDASAATDDEDDAADESDSEDDGGDDDDDGGDA